MIFVCYSILKKKYNISSCLLLEKNVKKFDNFSWFFWFFSKEVVYLYYIK